MERYDIIIIGAGVSGCAAARELSRDNRRIAVLERASDVCEGTSKANSGIVHAGFDAPSGTLKARLNVWGSERMEALSKELDFPFRRNGSLVLCFHKEELGGLRELLERGEKNGVKGLQILTPAQVWEREPGISRKIAGALYAPSGGIVCPFGLNIALAENAAENGVDFYFSHEVTRIAR
ncbi:MAG TPA: FAD-dependent oxidoreductase, partial [Candidatus Acetatifactor stercoripullorum]|nr:FAD-dependent oxidoreductase [Candidatus Acetatifactor stercoripullorum]